MSGQHQHGHQEGQQQRAAQNVPVRHILVAVSQRIDPTMQAVQFRHHQVSEPANKAGCKTIGSELWGAADREANWRKPGQAEEKPRFETQSPCLGVLWPFGFHAYRSNAAPTCPPPGPPARGTLALTVASFGIVAWVLLRRLIA